MMVRRPGNVAGRLTGTILTTGGNMIIHDISLSLTSPMLTYAKDVPYKREFQRSMTRGDSCNVSQLEMSAHAGTHVDAPLHFITDGYAIDRIPLDHLYGPAYVADCCGIPDVTAEVLREKLPYGAERVLLKTDNSALLRDHPEGLFKPDFVSLAGNGAQFLAERGVKLAGIDYLSIDKSGTPNHPSHHILLENNITILEGIILADVEPGEYFLACGSLKMVGAEGAPCRAVLIEKFL